MMPTLPQTALQFNRSIRLSGDGGELSSDTGQFLFREFDEKIGFSQTIAEHLDLEDERTHVIHTNESLVQQKIYQLLAGYHEDDAADSIIHDPVLTRVLGKAALASQPSLSRLYKRMGSQGVRQLEMANQALLDRIHHYRGTTEIVLDLDSSYAETYGKQEQSAYNQHYRVVGFHPLVAFDGLTGDFLKAQLRPGNAYTSNGVADFVRPLVWHYNEKFPETTIMVRGDSGFATPELYELCEQQAVYYIIRLKSNARLQALAEELHPTSNIYDVSKAEAYVEESMYQASTWAVPRRIVIQSVRPAGELFFKHAFFVTNLSETAFSGHAILVTYQKRGAMENFIKEAKEGFGFDQMKSHTFQRNEARLIISVLAYNFTNWLRTLTFPAKQKGLQIQTIRTRLIKVASKLVKSSRYLQFKLASSFVYAHFLADVLTRVQQLTLN